MNARTAPHGYTKAQRRGRLNNGPKGYGFRARNDWDSGELPAPYAQGDVVFVPQAAINERMYDFTEGYYIVTYCPSVDYGDGWYVRLSDDGDRHSDRLHMFFDGRCVLNGSEAVDWMAGVDLVDTSDPDGLALRERMIASGWTPSVVKCPTCGHIKDE